MKKADVYREYGIEYKNGKILSPFGTWIPELIPVGSNTKVGNAGTWSIYHGNETHNIDEFGPAAKTVLLDAGADTITGSCPCHCNGCYCDSGRYCFDAIKAGNIRKLLIARMYPDFMVRAIIAQVIADGIEQLRIHAAGDFFGPEYVDAWKTIVTSLPAVTFWTYTKYEYALNAFRGIPNISIVPSLTPAGVNFGTCAELLEKYEHLTAGGFRVHVCACGTDYEKHCSDCETGCKAVGTDCDYVLFIKHSTKDYKAGKNDAAEFDAVKTIIKSQDN